MPMMMSPVAIGLLWQLIYNPNLGLLTAALKGLGLVDPLSPPNFLGGSETALYAAFVPVIWNWGGFGMILTSAAILRIPADLYEAAAIDGADKAKQFFSITLPLLLPTIFLGMTINMFGAFKGFDLLYAMTGGGPANYTRLTSMYIYNVTFTENKFGYACAVSVILMAAVILFTIVFNWIGNRIDDKFTL
jgi:raffinose/stachyose/melibiose transport system permease protein